MTKYIPDKILTQDAYNAIKDQLDPTEVVVISDAVSPSAPLAVGSVQLRSDTGGDAPGTATYLTATDETASLPNSIDLGLLGTADAQNLIVNTPTAGEAVLTAVELVADSILNVNPDGELVSTSITADSFLTGNTDGELAAFVPGNDMVITTSSSGVPSSTTLSANTILYSDNTNVLIASATPSFADSFSLGTTGAGNVLSFSSEDELNLDAASGTLTSPDYTFTTSSGSTLTVTDATGFTVTPILAESFTVDTTAGSTFKYLGAASGTGTALVLNASNEIVLDTSSERFKENIRDAGDINSERIYELNLKLYNYKKLDGVVSEHSEKEQLGYIAEEVYKLIPEMVNLDREGKPFSLRTDVLLFILIEEVKKLKKLLADEVKS